MKNMDDNSIYEKEQCEDIGEEYKHTAMLDSLINSMPGGVGIFIFGERMLCEYYSDGFAKMAGLSRAEMNQKINDDAVLNTLIAPVDYERVMHVFRERIPKGEPLNMDYRYIYADGSIRWLHLSATKIREKDGAPAYCCVFTTPPQEVALYRNIVEESVAGVLVAEKASRNLLYINDKARVICDISGIELGQGVFEQSITQDKQKLLLNTEQVNSLQEDCYTEFHVQRQDRYYLVKAKALLWNGIPSYVLYINDETAEIQDKQYLEEARKKETTLMAGIPGGVAIYRLKKDGTVPCEFVTEGLAKMCGYDDKDEFFAYLAKDSRINVVKEDIHFVMEAARKSLITHEPFSVLYRIHVKGHPDILQRLDANIIESESLGADDLGVLYAVHTKVSEDSIKAMAEQARYRTIISNLDLAFIEVEIGKNYYASPKYYEYALSTQNFNAVANNQADRETVHPDDIPLLSDFFEKVKSKQERVTTVLRLKLKDGSYKWTEILSFNYYDKTGKKTRVVGILRDVDRERIEQNEKLREALLAAQKANKAKTAFLSRMSHDMRTPLNGILGLTSLIKGSTIDNSIREDLAALEVSGKYLLNLINDTLDVSKIESGKLELHPVVCDGRELFNDVLKLANPGLQEKHLTLTTHIENIPFTIVYMDRNRFEQAMMNVLSNAIKFTAPGGAIDISMRNISVDKGVITDEIVISDTGIGISPSFLPHIFEAFAQEDNSLTSPREGTGLGMAITKQLIDLMDGSISVESEVGKGTAFTITMKFPIATEEQIAGWHKTKQQVVEGISFVGKHILLCEDQPLNVKISKHLLEEKGAIIDIAENGQVAVDKFSSSALGYYDAILMDIRMPVMDGITATRIIRDLSRKDAATVPIIAMTANAFDDDVEKTRSAGMNAHLSKPIEKTIFYNTLANAMNVVKYLERKKVLIVDDIDVNRAVIRASLEADYSILEAVNGKEAQKILETVRDIDAVITDIQMPEMNGVELIRWIRSNIVYKKIIIIANSQFGEAKQTEELLALGVNEFVYKPESPSVIALRVKNALEYI